MMFGNAAMVLGFAMKDPSSRYTKMFLRAEHFDDPHHARVWTLINRLADDDERQSLPRRILPTRLIQEDPSLPSKSIYKLADVGLSHDAATEHDAAADRILAQWQCRRYHDAAHAIIAWGKEAGVTENPREMISRMEGEWFAAEKEVSSADTARSVRSPEEQGQDVSTLIKDRIREPESAFGLRSGWDVWDKLHRGARPGRMGFTIAPTGVGKTSFLLNLATKICDPASHNKDFPVPGLYVNLEMMKEDIDVRLAAIRLGNNVTLDDLESGSVSSHHADTAAARSKQSGLFVTDSTPKSIGTICALLARYAIRENIQWACVDHLLEVDMTPQEYRDTGGVQWKLHTSWIRKIHSIAQRYGFTVEVVGQCGGEDMDFSVGKEPSFHRMQGAKALLNHVDVARILWPGKDGKHIVSVKKNRGGRAGVADSFWFDKARGQWEELGVWTPPRDDDGSV